MDDRRTPRSGDDLFWFNEAKKAHAEAARLKTELHEATGLWYGACASRTEKAVEIARLTRLNEELRSANVHVTTRAEGMRERAERAELALQQKPS